MTYTEIVKVLKIGLILLKFQGSYQQFPSQVVLKTSKLPVIGLELSKKRRFSHFTTKTCTPAEDHEESDGVLKVWY